MIISSMSQDASGLLSFSTWPNLAISMPRASPLPATAQPTSDRNLP
jgi:hypothetical protein